MSIPVPKARDRRLFERYQTVLLVLQGYLYQQVSQIIGRSVTTVANYMKAYRRGGLGALNLREHVSGQVFRTRSPESFVSLELGVAVAPDRKWQ